MYHSSTRRVKPSNRKIIQKKNDETLEMLAQTFEFLKIGNYQLNLVYKNYYVLFVLDFILVANFTYLIMYIFLQLLFEVLKQFF